MTDFTSDRVNRALAWIGDSEGDLKSAYNSFNSEDYSWAAYIAATAAEKSLKAVIYLFQERPKDMHRHTIREYYNRALAHAPELEDVQTSIGVFDSYDSYLRYMDNVELSPARNRYGKTEANEALDAAEEILPAARAIVSKAEEIFQQYTN